MVILATILYILALILNETALPPEKGTRLPLNGSPVKRLWESVLASHLLVGFAAHLGVLLLLHEELRGGIRELLSQEIGRASCRERV